ncbi:MAG: bifunctional phosphoribosyl-AMP cyclohydrolase/phosphoribosyl-ATP diphosphatase [Flavobacteriaceae bacterium]|nr:MAG: bifunctional phosphoribosyl-AMP cyclohydrolase/phosphoribosyl-ATP diphosphatase [Flavobacteriaceae bacterium]
MQPFSVEQIDFNKSNGLVPVVVQNVKTKDVLMLGYMNPLALEKTLEEKKLTFFSRSKNRLWTKGESSGNFLHLVSISLDCDNDTLLVLANPDGPTCHTGSTTCWGEPELKNPNQFVDDLEKLIEDRKQDQSGKSYIQSLYQAGTHKIAQKVGEEATELVIESLMDNDDLFLEEASDLYFHYLILLHDRGYSFGDVVNRLEERHKKTK